MIFSKLFKKTAAMAVIASAGFAAMFATVSVLPDSGVVQSHSLISVNMSVPSALAGSGGTDGAGAATQDFGDTLVKSVNTILEVLYAFLIPLTLLAGWLLSPDWTFGDIFGLRAVIHSLWVLISNIVYIIFAFALVAIAFVNIYSGGGNFAIKHALPRFFVGILIVPFTWFIVSATLSVSNLLTASVLRLPYDMMTSEQRSYSLKIPPVCTLDFSKKDNSNGKAEGKIFDCPTEDADGNDTTKSVKLGDFISGGKSSYNILTAYAYSVFSIDDLKKIKANNIDTVKSLLDGGIQLIVGTVCFLVFALLLLALCFWLFTRAFYMWIIAIFSPLFGLFYFFEWKFKPATDIQEKVGFKTFIGLAMVPVYVSAALSFGLLFLTMTQNVDLSKKVSESSYWQNVEKGKDPGSAKFTLGQDSKWKPVMTIETKGKPLYVDKAADGAQSIVKLGQNAIGKIIVSILGVIVLWMSVMWALHGSKITATAIAPIEWFGDDLAKMAKAIPSHMPIIPTGKWWAPMNLAAMKAMSDNMKTAVEWAGLQRGRELGSKFGWAIAQQLGGMNETQAQVAGAVQRMGTSADRVSDAAREVRDAVKAKNIDGLKSGDAYDGYAKFAQNIPNSAFLEQDPKKIQEMRDKFTEALKKNPADAFVTLNGQLKPNAKIKNQSGAILTTPEDVKKYIEEGANPWQPSSNTTWPNPYADKIQFGPANGSQTPITLNSVVENKPKTFNIVGNTVDKAQFEDLAKHLGADDDTKKEALKKVLADKSVTIKS